MTTVVIVDDHPVFRRGLTALLRASGMRVVGEAASATEATEVVNATRPDVVLLDIGLPDASGITVSAAITARHPRTRVVVVSMHHDAVTVRRALDAGASGFVTKDAPPAQIIAAVRAAEDGATLLGPGVSIPRAEPAAGRDEPPGYLSLTERERAVAQMLAQGLPNPVVAERLGLSSKTVANYVSNVVLKLRATDRLHVARLMRLRDERGLADGPESAGPTTP